MGFRAIIWSVGRKGIVTPLFQHGDIVVRRNKRDERGTIRDAALAIGGRYYYRVLFPSSPAPLQVAETDLDAVKLEMSPEDLLLSGEFGDKSTFSRLLTYERLQRPLQDTLYSLRASRTEFQAYQFKPLLKFLRSSKQRLLLADEVGLGKTIEAGFILCEMLARHPHTFRRVLIVCKASLCFKWQMEMRKRFDLRFDIWRAGELREFHRRYREDEDLELRAICSLESFRNTGVMQDWEAVPPPLDVLIIDEAHHLKNSETKVHKACRTAAEAADAVLALTATPIQIGSRDLFNLLSLLDEEEFASFPYFEACMLFNSQIVAAEQKVARQDPDRFEAVHTMLKDLGENKVEVLAKAWQASSFRSSMADLAQGWESVSQTLRRHPLYEETLRQLRESDPVDRRATVEIQRNLSELNFLSRIFSRTRRRDVHQGSERHARVVEIHMTPAEQGLYKAVINFVRETYRSAGKDTAFLFGLMMPQRQLASCIPAMVEHYQSQVGAGAIGGLEDEVSDADSEDWTLQSSDSADARGQELRNLIRQWYQNGQPDSKFKALSESLEHLQVEQPGEQVVIFSYFKKTLSYLSRKLDGLGYSNTVISGSFSPDEREKRIAGFRGGKYQILLSSEVGSEGLDFQFCHILFNYDLPWNPMVVEQRIGRLDRFGQKAEKILIFNLSAPGTIEHEILTRLYKRINLFESYIGDLEAILGAEITNLTRDLFDPDLTEEQRKTKIDQAGLLLEKRKLQFAEWEKESPQFIGHDEYYRQEVDRAEKLGRFISAEDLVVFVTDFLRNFDRRSELVEESPGVFQLDGSDKLYQFILRQPEDSLKTEFLRLLHLKTLRATFDPDVAERNRHISFIHLRHFFIRAIVDEFRRNENQFHPVARIQLTCSGTLPKGQYVYLLGRATIRAAREQDALFPVIVDANSLDVLSEDASELCLGRMVTEGTDMPVPSLDPETLQKAYQAGQTTLVERFNTRRNSVERLNQAFVGARMASVTESYRLKISRKQILLENARVRQQQLSYIRMLEGTIRRLTDEQQIRQAEIEGLRSITAEYTIKAAGVVSVV
jgi:superfamily II DNA or RNA helicase